MGRAAKIVLVFSLLLSGADLARAYTLKSDEGKFSVEFPAAPEARIMRGVGSCESIRHEFRFLQGKRSWLAIYKDCKPPGMLADFGIPQALRDFSKGMAQVLHGEVRANDPIELGTVPGREFLVYIERTNLVVRGRVFVKGDRVYQVMYAGPAGTHEEPDIESFFASFRIMR